MCVCAKSLQLCLTFCHPVDCSPPSSSVQGVLQARILEWVAMPSSRGSSWSRDWIQVCYISCTGRWSLYCLCHLGKPEQSAISSVQSLSCVQLFVTHWTEAHQASLSITNFHSLLKLMSIWVSDAIQPSHPLLSHSPPAFSLYQH